MKKVYMWGTGRLAGKVLDVYYPASGIEGFIDNDCSKHIFMEKEVIRPETLREREYDAVLIANLYGEQIKKQSEDMGLNVDKFIFLYENSRIQDMNKDYGFVAKILGESYAKKIKDRYHLVRGLEMREKLCLEASCIF